MLRTVPSSAVSVSTASPANVDADLIIVPSAEGENLLQAIPDLDDATGGAVQRALASREIQGKAYELFLTPIVKGWRASRIGVIGTGSPADPNFERLRRVATAAALAAKQRRVVRLAFVMPSLNDADLAAAAQAVAEGLMLAAFNGDRYKSGERGGPPPEQMLIVSPSGGSQTAALERAVERGRVMGESSNIARDFCNEPSNV